MSKTLLEHVFPPKLGEIYDEDFANQLAETQGAVKSLLQTSRLLQNPDLLMAPILAKEAESSSQLEGTQASIVDAYQIDLTEQTAEKRNDALEIRNYESAMRKGLVALKKYGLNEMAIREMHKTLMTGVRGEDKSPGEYRKKEVWIGKLGTSKGKARYLPPDPVHVPKMMEVLSSYVKDAGKTNPLVACGVIHHRFEAIHPFEDGNGRVGRLLITLYLVDQGLLDMPILYPSGYFEENKSDYMDALSKVDKKEEWKTWLLFFLKGIQFQAELSLQLVLKIDSLYKDAFEKATAQSTNINLIKVLDYSFCNPFFTVPFIVRFTDIPSSTVQRYVEILEKLGVIEHSGTFKKQKVYVNRKLVDILREI
ncbi:MAG: Fic family protein [Patescibacteria group bacterium]